MYICRCIEVWRLNSIDVGKFCADKCGESSREWRCQGCNMQHSEETQS